MRCQPCWERKKIEKQALKDVMGTAMCRACFTGIPERDKRNPVFPNAGKPQCPSESALRIVNGFLPHIHQSYCACGQKKVKGATLCEPCKRWRANITTAKNWLRKWEETKEHHWLADAARLIETKRIQPEDFLRS